MKIYRWLEDKIGITAALTVCDLQMIKCECSYDSDVLDAWTVL